MFKDYYKILGITQGATSQQIKSAYRLLSKKWHPDKNPDINVTNIMQDINEAYAILKDDEKRRIYDIEYLRYINKITSFSSVINNNCKQEETCDYEIKDETLKEYIYEARIYAKNVVDELIKSLHNDTKKALKGAGNEMVGYICGFLLVSFVSMLVHLLISYNNSTDKVNCKELVDTLSIYNAPDTWIYHKFNSSFSLNVPNILEMRNEDDVYTCQLDSHNIYINNDIIVFQQKELSLGANDSLYLRVIIHHFKGDEGEFLNKNEIFEIDLHTKYLLFEIVKEEAYPFSLVDEPKYKWLDLNGIKILEIRYRRFGNNNHTTQGVIYLLNNNDQMIKMIVAYREQEKESWIYDMEQIIKTFKWEDN